MRPPIFSPPLTGTMPQQYLHRARMFRTAAMALPAYTSGEQNWPAYALLFHACELALKAFCARSVADGKPEKRASNHDLNGWYEIALGYGLPGDPQIAECIHALTELHACHYTRYPTDKKIGVPELANIADEVVDWLLAAVSPSLNPR
jgi:hypothetical protein